MRHAAFGAALLLAATSASAQTLTLRSAKDATIRGGTYESTNYGYAAVLETRASGTATYVRRALVMFDTASALASTAQIASATLVLTVKGGNAETRTLTACAVPISYDEGGVTWVKRKSAYYWSHAGGDVVSSDCSQASVTSTAYSHVTFDVTKQVQKAVSGIYGSRYARFLVGDPGASSRASYKEYFSNNAGDASLYPTLLVATGTTTTSSSTTASSTSSTSSTTLRVLQWNTHHGGYGTDGVYDPNRLASWAVKMAPDVVMFNEIEKYTGWGNQNQPEVYKTLLEQKTGRTWYYVFAQEFGQWSANGKGNLILSRFPIATSDRYELVHNYDRSIAAVSISVNARPITFILTHLDPYDATLRLTQATEVTGWSSVQPENRVITGDMNAWPDQTSIAQLGKYYYDSWAVAAANGAAIAFAGNSGETKKGRIDYIFYSRNSPNLAVKSSQVYDTRDANGVMPSDHRPVLTTFTVK